MKHKYLVYSLLSLAGMGLIGVSAVSAHGFGGFGFGQKTDPETVATHHQQMFQSQADLLGLNVNEIKNAWAEGKSLMQLAQDKGITKEQIQTKVQAQRLDQLKKQLDTLVAKGIITQAQADKRLATFQSQAGNKGKHLGSLMRFGHMGRGMMGR